MELKDEKLAFSKEVEEVFGIFSLIKRRKKVESKNEEIILQFYSTLIKNIKLEPLNKGYDVAYTEEDFNHIPNVVRPYLQCIDRILEEVLVTTEFGLFNSNFLKIFVSNTIYVSQFLRANHFWSNDKCSILSQKIIHNLLLLLDYNNGEECSDGKSVALFSNKFLKFFLEEFCQIFTKKTWKQLPSYKYVYSWLLANVKSPQLSEFVVYFLPSALFILDDWEEVNKVFAMEALQHIMENTPGSELRWHGRAEVIFEALNHNLLSREHKLLECAYPAAILAASILEKDPKLSSTVKKKYYDTVMDHLLSEMNYEEKIVLRTIYVNALKLLIQSMGIFTIKWSDLILEVCSNYLETYEGELAKDRLTVLEILQIYIQHCWSRISSHSEAILKMVLKMAYEINVTSSEVKNKDLVLKESKKVCDLLFAASPETTLRLVTDMNQLEVDFKEDVLFVISDILNKSL